MTDEMDDILQEDGWESTWLESDGEDEFLLYERAFYPTRAKVVR